MVVVTGEVTLPLLVVSLVTWLQVKDKAMVVAGVIDGAHSCRAALRHLQYRLGR